MALNNYGARIVLNGAQPNDIHLLLDAWDPRDVDRQSDANTPGGWAIALRASSVFEGGATQVNCAIARIRFGSGGNMLTVDVTIWPDTIVQVPSTKCRVEVLWDPSLPAGYTRPTATTIDGILTRSTSSKTNARLIRWLPRVLTTSTPELANIAVPSFARAVRPYGDELTSPAFSSGVQWSFTPGGTVRTGLNLAEVAEGGREWEFGAGIESVSGLVDVANFGGSPFTVPGIWGLDWRIDL